MNDIYGIFANYSNGQETWERLLFLVEGEGRANDTVALAELELEEGEKIQSKYGSFAGKWKEYTEYQRKFKAELAACFTVDLSCAEYPGPTMDTGYYCKKLEVR